ncbi:MAG: hypothetical protein QGI08_02620 [Paracoccaceae bacterium]|nr:hypothetical protein [Paracoccaceae bacterium]
MLFFTPAATEIFETILFGCADLAAARSGRDVSVRDNRDPWADGVCSRDTSATPSCSISHNRIPVLLTDTI